MEGRERNLFAIDFVELICKHCLSSYPWVYLLKIYLKSFNINEKIYAKSALQWIRIIK